MSTNHSDHLVRPTPIPVDEPRPTPAGGQRADALERLERAVEHAAHLLPGQGPITVFVHHNTLHAFEELPFETAVLRGRELYGCHAYLPEARFRAMLVSGRIRAEDLVAVLAEDLNGSSEEQLEVGGTRTELRLAMLQHPLRTGSRAELSWLLAETDALVRFRAEAAEGLCLQALEDTRRWVMRDLVQVAPAVGGHLVSCVADLERRSGDARNWDAPAWEAATLELLWQVALGGVRELRGEQRTQSTGAPLGDQPRHATRPEVDALVDPVLIRFCSAFLDQGFANWPLPERATGFRGAFQSLFRRSSGAEGWMRALPAELARDGRANQSPLESISESLDLLGVEEPRREEVLTRSLHALSGFAGMLWQLETNGEWTTQPAPKGTLLEYLSIRLVLERVALQQLAAAEPSNAEEPGLRGPGQHGQGPGLHAGDGPPDGTEQRAFEIFQLAQLRGWSPARLEALSRAGWSTLLEEVEAFAEVERQRVYQLAFERRYRHQTLDAVLAHCRGRAPESNDPSPAAAYQVVTCIDEREESFRRHLEELDPECETFGVAGFFGVAMYYRGATEAHFRPLCPVNIKPRHYVQEESVYSLTESNQRRARARRNLGRMAHGVHVGTRTMLGGVVTGLLGSLATFPLVLRVLFPRSVAINRRRLGTIVTPPATRLLLECTDDELGPERSPGSETEHRTEHRLGYRIDEMTEIVAGLLRSIGLTSGFAELVVIVGHGSSSLNNPHEAAHDCGACGGGRGGPNARAFAAMANDPRVRAALAARGLEIPDEVSFLGAYHNTCDDDVSYYDLDQLPVVKRAAFERARRALDRARRRNAHERCRRFESASLSLTADEALQHVQGRCEDLSQTRPEYGHATNALCFVGRRSWSQGLFLDRRTFLTSYDPRQDDLEHSILAGLLGAVIPVCAGINLEYYFSFVDPVGYGCGTKLPHNITSLLGVMNGAASDLRPGLPWQMVEIHEPVRILFLIECTRAALESVMAGNPDLERLIRNRWVQVAILDPESCQIHVLRPGGFELYVPESDALPGVESSLEWYRGQRDHLGFASIARPARAVGGAA